MSDSPTPKQESSATLSDSDTSDRVRALSTMDQGLAGSGWTSGVAGRKDTSANVRTADGACTTVDTRMTLPSSALTPERGRTIITILIIQPRMSFLLQLCLLSLCLLYYVSSSSWYRSAANDVVQHDWIGIQRLLHFQTLSRPRMSLRPVTDVANEPPQRY